MSKISALGELSETPASTDEFVIVDKSDTTQAATGTTKRMQSQYLLADASDTVKGKVELATTAETETGTDATRAVTPDAYRDAFATTEAAIVHAATEKTTPVDADELGLIDSAASYVLKRLTWTNVKATLKTYFDTFYPQQTGWISYSAVVPTRASADDPTYVLTFAGVDLTSTMSVGMKVKWTQNSTVRYGIITAIAFSTDTTLTLYGGTDYDVDDTATYAISAFHYSTQKAPLSFPLDPLKWSVQATDMTERTQNTPVAGTWYNLNTAMSVSVPIGAWNLEYFADVSVDDATGPIGVFTTLGTTTSTEADSDFRGLIYVTSSGTTPVLVGEITRRKNITIAAKTTYYVLAMTRISGIDKIRMNLLIGADNGKTVIRATCAYL